MRPAHRWAAVVLGTAVLVAVPAGLRAWPAQDRDVSAAALLSLVERGADHPYSGLVESQGTLQLPVADRFTDVGELFGGTTRMRVWWRSADAWRVDKLLTAGEEDLVHDEHGTTRWRYEQADVRHGPDPPIRLPRSADLVPPAVAHLLLDDVDAEHARRLPAARVAGVDALGLRLRPGAEQSSIDHVDLWADPGSGVVLRIAVVGKGATGPAFSSEFLEFSAATPAVARTSFVPPPGIAVEQDDVLDIADAANQFAPLVPPDTVAGLAKAPQAVRAVGVYGAGMTRLLAVPLRDQEADPLREQLRVTPGVTTGPVGTTVTVGPLGVLLTGLDGQGGWLVAGTVTPATLARAARDLLAGTVFVDER